MGLRIYIKMKKAVFTYVFARYSTVITGLVINAVLSRILMPADYGIVAVVTVFTAFFNVLSTLGLGTGVVQNKDLTDGDIEAIFSFTVWIAVAFAMIFFFCAIPISKFYEDSRYIAVVRVLSISVMFNALNVIPNAVLLKLEKFNIIACRMIISAIISGLVSIGLALIDINYWALIIQAILLSAIQFFWNIASIKIHFHLKIDMSSIKKIGNYSFYQFAYSIMLYASQNLDNLLLGKTLGSEQLAYYNKSYSVMRYPIDYIPHAISPVLHPILSKFQEDPDYIYKKYISMIKIMSLLGILISLMFFGEASEIIEVLFGSKWAQSVTLFRIFSLGVWVQLINALAGVAYQSTNNTRNMFLSGLIHVFITLSAIIIGICISNIDILVVLIVISWYIKFIIESHFLIKKSFHKKVLPYLKNFIPDIVVFAVTGFVAFTLNKYIKGGLFFCIFAKTLIIGAAYLISCLCFGQIKYFTKEYF